MISNIRSVLIHRSNCGRYLRYRLSPLAHERGARRPTVRPIFPQRLYQAVEEVVLLDRRQLRDVDEELHDRGVERHDKGHVVDPRHEAGDEVAVEAVHETTVAGKKGVKVLDPVRALQP